MSGNHCLFLTIGCALQPMVYLPSEFTFQFFHMFIMIPLNCAIGGAPSVAPSLKIWLAHIVCNPYIELGGIYPIYFVFYIVLNRLSFSIVPSVFIDTIELYHRRNGNSHLYNLIHVIVPSLTGAHTLIIPSLTGARTLIVPSLTGARTLIIPSLTGAR